MLLLLIFAVVCALGVLILKIDRELADYIGGILAIIGGCGVVLCGICIANTKVTSDAEYEKMKAKHEALMLADKSDIVTLSKDIAEYNGEVKARRELQKSLWFGLYQYDWWDDLDTIEIETLRK